MIEADVKKNIPEKLSSLQKHNTMDNLEVRVVEEEEKDGEIKTEEDVEEEEEEIPAEIKMLPEEEQQRAIIMLSFKTMMTGLLLVILFSDPMVDVLSALGIVIGVKPF